MIGGLYRNCYINDTPIQDFRPGLYHYFPAGLIVSSLRHHADRWDQKFRLRASQASPYPNFAHL